MDDSSVLDQQRNVSWAACEARTFTVATPRACWMYGMSFLRGNVVFAEWHLEASSDAGSGDAGSGVPLTRPSPPPSPLPPQAVNVLLLPPPLPAAPAPPTDPVLSSLFLTFSFILGFTFCFTCCLCVRCLHCTLIVQQRYKAPCITLTVFSCCSCLGAFWWWVHPSALIYGCVPEPGLGCTLSYGIDPVVLAGVGELTGIACALLIGLRCSNDSVERRICARDARRAARARNARAARAVAPAVRGHATATVAPDPMMEVELTTFSTIPVGVRVSADCGPGARGSASGAGHSAGGSAGGGASGRSSGSVLSGALARPPPLAVVCTLLRAELGLRADEPIPETVDLACVALRLEGSGTLIQRAERCWRALGSPPPPLSLQVSA